LKTSPPSQPHSIDTPERWPTGGRKAGKGGKRGDSSGEIEQTLFTAFSPFFETIFGAFWDVTWLRWPWILKARN